MRGDDTQQAAMFSYVAPEQRVPKDHPLRGIRRMVDRALEEMSRDFSRMYAREGRPSVPPEQMLRSLVLQVLYSIRSERLLIEQLEYNLLFRWFVGLSMDDAVWHHSSYSKNRERLIGSEVAAKFFERIRRQAEEAGLLSDEHFTVDGTLIEAWASMGSFRRKDGQESGDSGGDFHGQRRSNETHGSVTDPDARLARKGEGKEARLSYLGHVMIDNRNGLVVDHRLTRCSGRAEREAAADMVQAIPGRHRVTIGADKGYDAGAFVRKLRELNATPHVASKVRGSAIDGRTTRHRAYEVSQVYRHRVEQVFGWMKAFGLTRKVRHRGLKKVSWMFAFTAATYNLVRMRNLGLGVVT